MNPKTAISEILPVAIDPSQKRVILIESDYPLAAGLECLLSGEGDVVVKGISADQMDNLGGLIAKFHPHVLIMDEVFFAANLEKLYVSLRAFPEVRLITINLHDNILKVIDKKQVVVTRSEDLFSVL